MAFSARVAAQEAPDALVKRISTEVIDAAKSSKDIQAGNQQKARDLVEAKILPYVDFKRMTALATGRYWLTATPNQQNELTNTFRSLLIYTYSGALSQVKDQKVGVRPLRAAQSDVDVEVYSKISQPRGEPIALNYRLEKLVGGWKIYDVNIMGAWLIQTYKGTFASEISKGGIDGLIKTLAEKNKSIAGSALKKAK
jgi:phospholipid transport system substrate-binding protein